MPCASQEVADRLDRDYASELPRIDPLGPEEALGSFEILAGFEIQLVAAEPLVRDPIAMAFDEDGRLFVVEMRGYSEQRDENLGAVRLLEDTDGDGRYDKASSYVDGLSWPTAVACYDGGVFVGVAPDILYCKDTDGDGRADVREVVFTGFGTTNVQGLLNTFKWGVDLWIHGATSGSGAQVLRAASSGTPLFLRGRDFAFDPRTLAMVAESGGGQHGLTFDPWGRKFVSSNSDHIQSILFEDRYTGRNPYLPSLNPRESIASDGPAATVYRISPVEPWRIVRTRLRVKGLVPGPIEGGGTPAGYFTGATGVTIYRGDLWPEEFIGQAFIGDVGGNLVHRKVIEQDGLRFRAHRADEGREFLASSDNWFRPAQFCNGPEGALYVADMYREVIEHPASLPPVIKRHLDLTSGNDRGRIYRIVPEGYEGGALPRLSQMTSSELTRLLGHKNGWHRNTAARLLFERNATDAIPALRRIAVDSALPAGRIQALHLLERLGGLQSAVVLEALEDTDSRVRERALILAESFVQGTPELVHKLSTMVDDASPRVRYQLAFSLGALEARERVAPLAALARRDNEDRLSGFAVLSSASGIAGALFATIASDESELNDEGTWKLIEELTALVAAEGDEKTIAEVLATIEAFAHNHERLAGRCVRGIVRGLLSGGRRDVRAVLAASPRAERLLRDLIDRARKVAVDDGQSIRRREDAIRTLTLDTFDSARTILPPLFRQREPDRVQIAALRSLGVFEEPAVASIVLSNWAEMSPVMRSQGLETLFSRRMWLSQLLDALGSDEFDLAQIPSTRISNLREHRDEEIRMRAEALLSRRIRGDGEEIVAAYRGAIDMKGDPAKGRQLFVENCAQCHRLGGAGYALGPDLKTVRLGGPEKILVGLLDPNREIDSVYVNYLVDRKDWEMSTGVIVAETAASITLRRPGGVTETILRTNIDAIRSSNLSIMPEGWEESLDVGDVADLLAYINSVD